MSRGGQSLSMRGSLSGGGSLSTGVSVQEGGGSVWGDRDPNTVTSGRYASYWNAFLFSKCITL